MSRLSQEAVAAKAPTATPPAPDDTGENDRAAVPAKKVFQQAAPPPPLKSGWSSIVQGSRAESSKTSTNGGVPASGSPAGKSLAAERKPSAQTQPKAGADKPSPQRSDKAEDARSNTEAISPSESAQPSAAPESAPAASPKAAIAAKPAFEPSIPTKSAWGKPADPAPEQQQQQQQQSAAPLSAAAGPATGNWPSLGDTAERRRKGASAPPAPTSPQHGEGAAPPPPSQAAGPSQQQASAPAADPPAQPRNLPQRRSDPLRAGTAGQPGREPPFRSAAHPGRGQSSSKRGGSGSLAARGPSHKPAAAPAAAAADSQEQPGAAAKAGRGSPAGSSSGQDQVVPAQRGDSAPGAARPDRDPALPSSRSFDTRLDQGRHRGPDPRRGGARGGQFSPPLPSTAFSAQQLYYQSLLYQQAAYGFAPAFVAGSQEALLAAVAQQIEYYFSVQNLCKDVFLRARMDDGGWIPLEMVAGFNRVRALTPDLGTIVQSLRGSHVVETSPDGRKLRPRGSFQTWVLPPQQRDSSYVPRTSSGSDAGAPSGQPQRPPHSNAGVLASPRAPRRPTSSGQRPWEGPTNGSRLDDRRASQSVPVSPHRPHAASSVASSGTSESGQLQQPPPPIRTQAEHPGSPQDMVPDRLPDESGPGAQAAGAQPAEATQDLLSNEDVARLLVMTQPHLMAEPNFAQPQAQDAVPASSNEAELLNESMFHIERGLQGPGSEEASTSEPSQSGPPDSWPRHFYPHVLPQNGSMLSFLHGIGPSTSLGWCLAPQGFSGPAEEPSIARMSEPNTPRTPGGTRSRTSEDNVRMGKLPGTLRWPDLPGPSKALLERGRFQLMQYQEFHRRCLASRCTLGAGMSAEMTTLFRFWGELLAGNFNRSMYSEFYMLAAEDLALGRHYGAQCLFRCYLAMLSSRSGGPDLLHDFETRALQMFEAHGWVYGLEKLWQLHHQPGATGTSNPQVQKLFAGNFTSADAFRKHAAHLAQERKDQRQQVHSVAEPDTNGMVSAAVAPSPKRAVPRNSSLKSVASSSSLARVQSSGNLGQSPEPKGSSGSLQAVAALLRSADSASSPRSAASGKLGSFGAAQGEAGHGTEAARTGSCGQNSSGSLKEGLANGHGPHDASTPPVEGAR